MRLRFFLRKRITHVLTSLLLVGWGTVVFAAATPTFVNYQGYLTNSGGTAQTGTAPVTVRIYDASSGGTLLFEENEGTVTITN